ncbi:hypothetical protein CC85DRAFT_63786 [Cutaneotrichosporon oleaginosum]|uniref:Uncharacterized protein n=1 Tax=Cutaneotrichosporon oleaginosum TaxID=879819 RepID=A0A0J0XPY8_9TREE|nr:uncharacterized protein CC85DRAFT_63786 [Cutaneotrichosporon oleaginosum]KLT43175.1 hypothetical protein CC85DRAFT_63786 [Cutaneotrichosporon oleaginosum]TXT09857.1 hypothetical protein COLE_03791 [Cutaneotrichosporon oleaginosum]
MIDSAYYPHLVEGIMDAAPHEALLAFRASCKHYKQRADARLFTRVCLLPRAEAGMWGYLFGSLCAMPTSVACSSISPTESRHAGVIGFHPLPAAISHVATPSFSAEESGLPTLSSSPTPTPPASRPVTPSTTVYSRLPLGPPSAHDNLCLTRVLDLPPDDAPRGDALQPLLWRLEQGRPLLEIVRNHGSRLPRCILPRAHTFVDFAIPWNTYLLRLGSSMFPPGTQRAVLHAGGTMHPNAVEGSLGTVLAAMTRCEMPRSVKSAVVVVGMCEVGAETIVQQGLLLYELAQQVMIGTFTLEIVGIECALKIPLVDSDGRDITSQIAHRLAPFVNGSTCAEVTDVLSCITHTPMESWMGRAGVTSRLECRFDV